MDTPVELTRGIATIFPNQETLEKILSERKQANIYVGIDPTAIRIHLGHAVVLRKLQQFVEAGHNVTFLIGDFTALIGDTSDKEGERPILTSEEIAENFTTYKEQAAKILDFSKVKVVHNSEWLKDLTFTDIVKLCQHFSVGDFVGRELIKKRLHEGKKVGLHETLYPVMQGYDSFFLDTDVQIGGSDQTFNMLAGRTLQKDLRQKESAVLCVEYLPGTDGRKMSKTWGNAIWLTDTANEIYGKVMSLRDDLVETYFTLATSLPRDAIETQMKEENPMTRKKRLAFTIAQELTNPNDALEAEKYFELTFQQKKPEVFEPIEQGENTSVQKIVAQKVGSSSEARRLILAGAVDLNGETVVDSKHKIAVGDKLQVGKRIFLEII